MENKTIFVRSSKGEDEIRSKTAHLSGDIKRALLMVDGTSTFGEISKRSAPSLRSILGELFLELEKGGFIQDKTRMESIAKLAAPPIIAHPPQMVMPVKMSTPGKRPTDEGAGELDFTAAFRAPSPEVLAAEAAKVAAEKAEAQARQEAEAAKLKAHQEAEAERHKAEQEAARVRAEQEATRAKAEAEARAREEAERRAQAEAAKLKAQQEAEAAHRKAEAEARARAEAEAKARQEIEAARLKAQQEMEAARRRAEEEAAMARREAEAAKLKAQQEAEAARRMAEQEAAKAREEAERARQQAAAEAKAREDAERRAREEADAARVKAEQEAAQVRAELEAARAKAEAEARAREEAERRAQVEAEAARLKAQQEAESARHKAEEDAAKARQEAEAAKLKAQQEAEEARHKAEQEAARAREEAERAKLQAAAEAKAREEAERRAREEADAARVRAEQEAARIRAELETARSEAEAKAREEADRQRRAEEERSAKEQAADLVAQQQAEAMLLQSSRDTAAASIEALKPRPSGAASSRSTSATVLFLDVVGYTKQSVNKQIQVKKQFNQLLSDCLAAVGEGERIILDTGDGAAVGFLQHPEDALEAAMQFRKTVTANQHKDYPDLNVRIGIHLGPINVVKDMNGQSNMVGDGINDAQRVMSFAGSDQIYVSRPYYDFISRLSDEYADLFEYRGSQKDKHGREHQVYELVEGGAAPAVEIVPLGESAAEIKLEPFSIAMPAPVILTPPEPVYEEPEQHREDVALISEVGKLNHTEEKAIAAERVSEKAAPETVPAAKAKAAPTKPVAEVRMPSEEDVRKLAETQAKAWAAAEQRALETARNKAERAPEPSTEVSKKPVERARRKPFPWGKVGGGLLVVALGALFVIPYLLPMKDYATRIEQQLSDQVHQPVHIGKLSGRILPTPTLEMGEVSFGETKQVQVQQARVNFAFSALFSSTKPINSVELEGLQVNGAELQKVSSWMRQVVADQQHPVASIKLSQGKVEAEGVTVTGVGGELKFDRSGKFAQAKLQAQENKYSLDINAVGEKMQVAINVHGAALPLLPNWVFDDLSAKGELTADGLQITEMDSRIKGGILLGDASIDWRSGWRAQGNLVAKTITLQNLNKLLEGDMDGKARFRMQSVSLAKLTETAMLDGDFVVKKGVINGMDIVETARLRSRTNLPGGRTHFDELTGDLNYSNGAYHFRKLKMQAGVLAAAGSVDIAKQEVSGNILADLSMRTAMGSVGLQVGGTTESLTLRAR
ncbi:MAG TPA: AsmA-like C-terminal region-containing protein [Gallionella sp.]|nr:AsmA-like C-terminal region-containing protein [Gallionella sp.]